jgi:rhamnose transport system substrate-binding protein
VKYMYRFRAAARMGGMIVLVVALGLAVGCQSRKRAFTVGFMPKLVGIPYFNACKKGAEEAATELNLELRYDGPTQAEASLQKKMLDQWIASQEVDALAVACAQPQPVDRPLKRAREQGLLVVTYDADTVADARQFFVNMATYDAVAQAMVDALAEDLHIKKGEKGEALKVAILTSSIQAPNQSEWARRIKDYVKSDYPRIALLGETEHGEDRSLGIQQAKSLIQTHKDLKGFIGLTSVAVPAAAEAVQQEGKAGEIKVTGVSTPKDMRAYVKNGTVNTVILWNPVDLGYLTVYVIDLLRQGKMPVSGTIKAGRLGKITVTDREVLLGKPIRFTRDNIDDYDF